MTRPLISVVVPVYNHERFLREGLMSIIEQSYRPLQLIVIDDGSSDNSAEVARTLLRRELPDSIFIQRENRGAHNTINQGLRMASGDYLTILNSDDSFRPGRLERCMATIERTGCEFLFTDVSFMDDASRPVQGDPYVEGIKDVGLRSSRYPTVGFALMKNQLGVSTGNFIFSRRLFDLVGEFRHYRYVHDWDFILRSLFHTEPHYLREELYNYRIHGSNTFKSLGTLEGYETAEVMRNFLWLMTSRAPDNPRAPCPHYWPGFFDWFIQTWDYHVYTPPSWKPVFTR